VPRNILRFPASSPEMVANAIFGGAKFNRLFICGTTSSIRSALPRMVPRPVDGRELSFNLRQRELKPSTLRLVFARPQPSAVFFDDGEADRKSHAHAAGFCRVEWLER
jgi:hypothetical protein